MRVWCALLGVALGALITNTLWLPSLDPFCIRAFLMLLASLVSIGLACAIKYDWK